MREILWKNIASNAPLNPSLMKESMYNSKRSIPYMIYRMPQDSQITSLANTVRAVPPIDGAAMIDKVRRETKYANGGIYISKIS